MEFTVTTKYNIQEAFISAEIVNCDDKYSIFW